MGIAAVGTLSGTESVCGEPLFRRPPSPWLAVASGGRQILRNTVGVAAAAGTLSGRRHFPDGVRVQGGNFCKWSDCPAMWPRQLRVVGVRWLTVEMSSENCSTNVSAYFIAKLRT